MAGVLLSAGTQYHHLPENYTRPKSQRPLLSEVSSQPLPIVDLRRNSAGEEQITRHIGDACRNFSFFQVVNHGISPDLMREVIETAREFFHLPVEEKMRYYSEEPLKKMRLSTSSNVRTEKVRNWRDYLRLHCHPLEEFVHEWPSAPHSFKDVMSTYCKEVRNLGIKLLEAISLSLGLERDYMERLNVEKGQHMAINYYPRCPEPELTYGLPSHTDPNTLTILLLDNEVAGLQVLKNGCWVAVDPAPNALVVIIGDQLQALSNGRYKSLQHRAVVNSERERISVASFICPASDAILGPAQKLTSEDSPAMYNNYTYDEYFKKFWDTNLEEEHCLELFRVV